MKELYCAALCREVFFKEVPENSIKPCCVWQGEIEYDQNQPITQIFSSPEVVKAKQKMKNGEWPKECIRCRTKEEIGQQSDRLVLNRKHGITNVEQMDESVLRSIDYRNGNLCNLKCRMCHPSDSHLIQKEIENNYAILKDTYRNAQYEVLKKHDATHVSVNTKIVNHDIVKNLIEFKILGGEPSIDPNVHNTLEWIIDNDYAKDIQLKYTTNLTNVNAKWLGYHTHFKKLRITFSLDGAGQTYNYVRTNGNWQQIKQNLKIYKETFPDALTSVNFVFSMFNCMSLDEWYDEFCDNVCHDLNSDLVNVNHSSIHWQQPRNLPIEIKEKILKILHTKPDTRFKSSLIGFIELPELEDSREKIKKFILECGNLDKVRSTDLRDIAPLYIELLDIID